MSSGCSTPVSSSCTHVRTHEPYGYAWALWSALLFSACAPESAQCDGSAAVPATGVRNFHVLSYNIGNPKTDGPYALRLSDRNYEQGLAKTFRELSPDLVFLQEVLSPDQCKVSERDPERSCFDAAHDLPQVRRLLGDAYSIVCDDNRHTECLGVHRSFGIIRGLPPGGLDLDGANTAPLPGEPCNFSRGECTPSSKKCDAESSISSVVIDTPTGPIRAVHAHPTAGGHVCLQRQLMQAFDLADEATPTILAGDWNFDPSNATDLVPASIWHHFVGDGRFVDHSPRDADCHLARTSVAQPVSLDRVVTDFALGVCKVWTNPRLDAQAETVRQHGERADHYAVECKLATRGMGR